MKPKKSNTGLKDKKILLSTLWIFATLNYIYADVFTLMDPVQLKKILNGVVIPFSTSESFLLGAAILMETAIAMVVLSRILKYGVNRWANIIVGIIHTLAVFSSMFVGKPALYYLFFGVIEIGCTLIIIWIAWKWRKDESN